MLLMMALLIASCASREEVDEPVVYIPAAERLVMVVGDSLSNGHGIERHEGWVALLQERLAHRRQGFQVVNFSLNGATSFVGRSRIRDQLELNRPDIVIVALGGNDAILRLPLEKVKDNLDAILAELQSRNIKTLLVGLRIPEKYDRLYAEAFAVMYVTLADKYGVVLVPHLMEGVLGIEQYMQRDGVHPNMLAQPRMLENVWPRLERLLD